jgi:tight adherence protein B
MGGGNGRVAGRMIGTVNPVLLIIVSGACLAGAGVGLYAHDRRMRARNLRIAGIVFSYARAAALAPNADRSWGERAAGPGPGAFASSLLRIEISRSDLYPTKWWVVLAVATLVAAMITGVVGFFAGPPAWIGFPLIWIMLVRMTFGSFLRRRSNILYMQLPDALAMIVRSVRAGIPVPESLRIVGEEGQWPTSMEFVRLYDEIRLGGSLPEALVKLAQRSSLLDYRFFAVALSLQSQSGGSLTETLENLADVVRKRVALKQRAIALSSEARMTMWVLACLPFITGGALWVLNPTYISVLFTTSVGKMILLSGVALLVMGIGSMNIIIKKSVS